MERSIAVIGVGNMAKAIINGIISSTLEVSRFRLFDTNPDTYKTLPSFSSFEYSSDIESAVDASDIVLLSVKPQNYTDVLKILKNTDSYSKKLYISIAAGISSESVSEALGGATVIRVLPNLPMTIGKGLSVICNNEKASDDDFEFVKKMFEAAGSILVIDENEMNRIIGVTSSSPAYVFRFINAIAEGAKKQGLDKEKLINAICDVLIGSAYLLKNSGLSPEELISRVASKGGTTQKALDKLDENSFDDIIAEAMIACTARAEELGK